VIGGRNLRNLFTGVVLCAAPVFAFAADLPAIVWQTQAPAVEVTGLGADALQALAQARTDAGWPRLFTVRVAGAASGPMAGEWSVTDGRLRFAPRYPWAEGVTYRAEFRGPSGPPLESEFSVKSAPKTPVTTVAEIFPSGSVLPENQLKFYVQFSGPMSRGGIYRHIQLRRADGKVPDLPFLEIDEELWDPGLTRVTLLIDPGRIKRGVKPLVEIGPVFEEGHAYALTIDADWRDAEGRPLKASFTKQFKIGPADRTAPDVAKWRIAAPPAGTREPLLMEFDGPMDAALALSMIGIVGADGKRIDGDATLLARETRWKFVPAAAWRPGAGTIYVRSTIEDLAGNNPGKLFDVDVFERVERRVTTDSLKLPFEVK
jgi:hypothetical protein